MSIAILGIDLGKNSCSVVGVNTAGAVTVRRTMRRQTLIDYVAKLPSCVVAMEACCGAHHLGRLFTEQGHEVRLMSPEYVRPYIKAQKNDDRDAEGIAEAASRPTMRFVELKSQEQLDVRAKTRRSCSFMPISVADKGPWAIGSSRVSRSRCRRRSTEMVLRPRLMATRWAPDVMLACRKMEAANSRPSQGAR